MRFINADYLKSLKDFVQARRSDGTDAPTIMRNYRDGGLYPDGGENTMLRDLLRAMPEKVRIYLALTFWSLISWPMAFAHVFNNLDMSPNTGNAAGVSFGFFFEGVILTTGLTPMIVWRSEALYRRLCLSIFSANMIVVISRLLIVTITHIAQHSVSK